MTTLPAGTNLLYRRHTIILPCDIEYSADKSTAIIGSAKMALTQDLSTIIWISDKELEKQIHDQWLSIIKEKGLPKYTLKAGTPVMWAERPILTTKDYTVYVAHGDWYYENSTFGGEFTQMDEVYQPRGDSDGYLVITQCAMYGSNIELNLWERDSYPELQAQWEAAEKAYNELTHSNIH